MKTKFKVGDEVRCVKGWGSKMIVGETYTIKRVTRLDTVEVRGVEGCWNMDRFIYASAVTNPHLVIAKTDTGFSPNENPKVHPSFDAAAAEAQRLAKTIGGEFVVFAPVAKAVAPKVEVEFTKL